MMKMENVEFPEALAMLGSARWHPLKPTQTTPAAWRPAPIKTAAVPSGGLGRRTISSMRLNARSRTGPRYLAERKITPESIQKFSPGFCPDRWIGQSTG